MRQGVQAFGSGQLKAIGGMIGGAFAVGAITRFAAAQLRAADDTMDLSETLGVQAETLQTLESVGKRYGATMAQVKTAIQNLNKTGGGQGTPEQQLESLAREYVRAGESGKAMEEVQRRLGRSGKDLVGVLRAIAREGLQPLIDAEKSAGRILDERTVSELATAQGLIEITQQRATVAGTTILGGLIRNISVGKAAIGQLLGGQTWEELKEEARRGDVGIMGEAKNQREENRRNSLRAQRRAQEAAVAAIEEQRAKQESAAAAARDKAIGKITVGEVNAADSMAARGAFIGGQASYQSAVAERQLKELEIISEYNAKMLEIQTKSATALEDIGQAVED
jgi:hypothetical protein